MGSPHKFKGSPLLFMGSALLVAWNLNGARWYGKEAACDNPLIGTGECTALFSGCETNPTCSCCVELSRLASMRHITRRMRQEDLSTSSLLMPQIHPLISRAWSFLSMPFPR